MATFKVGQRVKVVGHVLEPGNMDYRGHEGVITGFEPPEAVHNGLSIAVQIDRVPHSWCFAPHELAPLTDPKADEFIEKVKNWEPLREPVPA